MRSSGGVATVEEAAAHPAWALVSGPAAGVVGAALVARLAGLENAISFDMGGTSTDVCLIVGRRRQSARRSGSVGGPADPAADGRHPHGRRRRRLDRVARRGRRAARRAGERRRRSRARLLRARRDAADRDRREPPARPAAAIASRAGSSSTARPPSARSAGIDPAAVDRGRERRDAARAAGRLGRARPRPARLRARRIRRRGAAARVRARGGARDRDGARPGRGRRAVGARARRERRAARPRRARTSCPLARGGRAARRGRGRPALPRPVVRADGAARRPGSAERFHRAHEERYGYADREREIELVAVRTADVRPGPEFASRRASRSTSPARDCSSSTAPPAGFPPGGWGLGMVAR